MANSMEFKWTEVDRYVQGSGNRKGMGSHPGTRKGRTSSLMWMEEMGSARATTETPAKSCSHRTCCLGQHYVKILFYDCFLYQLLLLCPSIPAHKLPSLHACFLTQATYYHDFLLHIYTIASFWAWNPISKCLSVLMGLLHRHPKFSRCSNTGLWSPIPLLLYLRQRHDQPTISRFRDWRANFRLLPSFSLPTSGHHVQSLLSDPHVSNAPHRHSWDPLP